ELLGHLEEKLPADFELLPLLRMHRAIPDEVLETEEPDGTTPAPDAASNTDGKKPAATPDEGKPAVKKRDATEDADVKKPDAGKPDAGKPGTSEKSGAKKPAASEPTRAAPNAKKPKDDEPAGDAGTDPPPPAADDPDTSQG
ncbi:MAG: hypothetical protein QGF59_24720, partial [Pirellulaceae bacterium]|nr:hypothetical protein [Pirellulaceae bacterium]